MTAQVRRRPGKRRRGLVVGVTGGVATGKSTVARLLAGNRGVVLEADRIGHELTAPGRAAWREIRRTFGRRVERADGSIDRRKLGAVVFRQEAARRRLNKIVHPRLLRELARLVSSARRRRALVVIDAALLIEWGWGERVDVLVVVDAPRREQLRRLVGLGFTWREARDRVQSQLSRREKRAAADAVLVNDGSRRRLGARVRSFRRRLDGWQRGTGVLRNESSERTIPLRT